VDLDCIQEPLKGAAASLYESTSNEDVEEEDDDSVDLWAVIAMTAGACTVFFLALQVVVFQYQKKKLAAEHADDKQSLNYH
jgi:hypothetical protein